MLRLTELKLPLGHPPQALAAAAAERLGVEVGALRACTIARRAHDARRRSAILMVYSVDVVLDDEAAILARLRRRSSNSAHARHLLPASPAGPRRRPFRARW